jgi:hypothetical protein
LRDFTRNKSIGINASEFNEGIPYLKSKKKMMSRAQQEIKKGLVLEAPSSGLEDACKKFQAHVTHHSSLEIKYHIVKKWSIK